MIKKIFNTIFNFVFYGYFFTFCLLLMLIGFIVIISPIIISIVLPLVLWDYYNLNSFILMSWLILPWIGIILSYKIFKLFDNVIFLKIDNVLIETISAIRHFVKHFGIEM